MTDLTYALDQASKRGWRVHVSFDGASCISVSAERGDSNCPHQGPYSPATGHGFEAHDNEDGDDLTFTQLIDWILALEDFKP